MTTESTGIEINKPREACGVFGVLAAENPVAHQTYLGLYALQHRGQESAGIAAVSYTHLRDHETREELE